MSASKLFQENITINNLKDFYTMNISHKATPGIDRINRETFEKCLDDTIKIIHKKTLNGTYKFTPYKEKLVSKGKNKAPRVISIPTIRDKITLGVLHEILKEVYKEKVNVKITQTLVDELKDAIVGQRFTHFIKIDIKGFYDHINRDILFSMLKKKIKKDEVLSLLKKAILNKTVPLSQISSTATEEEATDKGVPQGISISNILANIYLSDIDAKFQKKNGIAYFRYVDDILILCTDKNKNRIYNSIKRDFSKLELSINDKEDAGKLTKGFDYLGYKYALINKAQSKYGFSVKKKNIFKLENSLINIFSDYKYHKNSQLFIWNINLRITGFILDKSKYGWLFFYSQIDDYSILYHLDWFVEQLCNKFNVSSQLRILIKKFVKAYFEIKKKKGKSKYIPKSEDFSEQDKKKILIEIYGFDRVMVNSLDSKHINKLFKSKLYISVKELEKDVQSIS